ncbi:MAG: ribulose-phosphate 3-epimerase [Candidatus Baltobacteraceae bacterium]
MIKLAPSILSADFSCIASEVAAIERGGASYVHIDVMDGVFVPNITWGPKVLADLRAHSKLVFDTHLMIVQPERYVDDFRDAGADIITFHLEATPHAHRLLGHIRAGGARAGISICPQTPVAMVEDLAGSFDLLLVMSVNPGFGGQAFIPHAIEKVRQAVRLRERSGALFEIEVDGGVNLENARSIADAGADVLVAGSAIFDGGECGQKTREFLTKTR